MLMEPVPPWGVTVKLATGRAPVGIGVTVDVAVGVGVTGEVMLI
jgi:hypothetical protein